MPVKKTVSKKRKKASSKRKKAAVKKTVAKKSAAKKSAARKRKVTKKKAASSKKKVSRKKVSAKKPAARKVSKKKVSKKKVGKKKVGKKKVSKKKVSKKKVTTKKVSKKKSASKKTVRKKKAAPKKAAGKKMAAPKKAASKKKTALKKPAARKTAVRKKPVTKKAPAPRPRSSANLLSGPIHGISPYKPRRGEDYMSDKQVTHFREILSAWKSELIVEVDRTVHHMQDEAANFPDPNDRATQESEFGLELRTRDRERKLLRKIDSALARLDDASYGYCDETGEEIGMKRLEARPVATLCVEAQERREQAERQFRDRDDRYR